VNSINVKTKPILHCIELEGISILQQLRWEEALLRADHRNWFLYNQGSPLAVVLGISCKVQEFVCAERMKEDPIPLIRRFSGGGSVVVNPDTLFSTFICQEEALAIPPFPKSLMEWSANIYRPLFPPSLFDLQENDYIVGNRKWGGNAQLITKKRWIHHSSLLWDYHSEQMNYLLMPSKTPVYRQGRKHADFLCRLREFYPDRHLFYTNLREQLNLQFTCIEASVQEVQRIADLPHRQTTALLFK
jgi:lipoate-protein ligase A